MGCPVRSRSGYPRSEPARPPQPSVRSIGERAGRRVNCARPVDPLTTWVGMSQVGQLDPRRIHRTQPTGQLSQHVSYKQGLDSSRPTATRPAPAAGGEPLAGSSFL